MTENEYITNTLWTEPYTGSFRRGFRLRDRFSSTCVDANEVPALVAWLRETYPEAFNEKAPAPVASSVSDDTMAAYERGVVDVLAFVRGGGRA